MMQGIIDFQRRKNGLLTNVYIYILLSSSNSVFCKLQGLLSSTTKGIKRRFG